MQRTNFKGLLIYALFLKAIFFFFIELIVYSSLCLTYYKDILSYYFELQYLIEQSYRCKLQLYTFNLAANNTI